MRYEKQVMDGTQMMSSPGKLSTKPQPDNSSSVNEAINSIISRSGILNSPIVLEKSEPATGSRDHSKRIELKRPEQVANTKYDLSSRSVADVVILGSPFDANWNTDVQDKLLSTGLFSSVSVVNIATVTPTLAELQAFDAALVYSDGPGYNDPVLFGDNLADYVDGGGGVVCAVFSTASIPFAGRFDM
ncbi:MAG: hypothetical protein GWN13_09185, partial [Phycisphaerae bacterium]|nr:hypothetical protein [Phycisphaerae bacterium]